MAILLIVTVSGTQPATAYASAAIARAISGLLQGSGEMTVGGEPIASHALRPLYAARDDQPVWTGDPAAEAAGNALLQALAAAPAQGLGREGWHRLALASLPGRTAAALAERDVLLTDAFLRYARALRQGLLPTTALGGDWGIPAQAFDPAAALLAANRDEQVTALLGRLAPADPGYGALAAAYQRYHAIAVQGGWPDAFGAAEIKLETADPRLADLQRRLLLEQDLPPGGPADVPALRAAVRRFQSRHGLEADGRIGARTLAALNVAAEPRVAQIAVNLERWRHLPHEFPARRVVVNVADAGLMLVEPGRSRLEMRVIVGDTKHPTPVLAATIAAVTFNPPWNIPASIAVKEMLPKLRRHPDYLAANNIIVRGRDDDPSGRLIDWRAVPSKGFPFRLQQLPGPKNSLGGIKFEMPNRFDVYLHDTPAKALFERPRRGFSHGCVRLQHPAELAAALLADPPVWNADSIAAALAQGATRQVPLPQPVPVYLLYWTAFVDASGQVNFRDDLYGRDAPLEALLAGQAPAPLSAPPEVGCPVG